MPNKNLDHSNPANLEAEIGLLNAVKAIYVPKLAEMGILQKAAVANKQRQGKVSGIVRSARKGNEHGLTNEFLEASLILQPLVYRAEKPDDLVSVPAILLVGKKLSPKGKLKDVKEVVPMQDYNAFGNLAVTNGFTPDDVNAADEIISVLFELKSSGILSQLTDDLSSIEVPEPAKL